MLNSALQRLFSHIRSFHIPCVVVRNHSLYIPIKPISASDWCFLQSDRISLNRKLLIFNILLKPSIIRVFAPEEESVRKYALIFRGRTGNQGGKIRICFQFESATYCCHSGSKKPRCTVLVTRFFIVTVTR